MNIQYFALLLGCLRHFTKSNRMHYNDYYLMTRNNLLRTLLSTTEYRKTRVLLNKTTDLYNNIYNKILSMYYDTNGKYYSLSEDDKTIIETIISLCY